MDYKRKIKIYDNLITAVMAEDALDIILERGFRYGWQSNGNIPYGHWNLALTETGTFYKNRKDVTDELPPAIKKIWDRLAPIVGGKNRVPIRAYFNAHTYGTEGYVHKDSNFADDLTVIMYMNRTWEPNWAGETVIFEKKEIIKAVIPKWKRILLFPSTMRHAARAVSRYCPEARTVLVFKARKTDPK